MMIRRDSYARIAAELIGLLLLMTAIAFLGLRRDARPPDPPAPVASSPAPIKPDPPKTPAAVDAPTPERIVVRDDAAIRAAEDDLEAVKRDRIRAEGRSHEAADRLQSAQSRLATAVRTHKSLASTIKDPTPRLVAALSRGEALKGDVDKINARLGALNAAPRPRRKPLIDKSPVAKVADGEEFHFEVRGDHIAFIDLERLLDRVKTDARVQLRLTNGNKPASGTVGPVGAFSMSYEVTRVDDGSSGRVANFGLSGWEIVPDSDRRGETFATAMLPASNFSRAINRLAPSRDVVTLWIYPDGFALYRELREALHARGLLVAARPLPEGITIKGSPGGSTSSAQ